MRAEAELSSAQTIVAQYEVEMFKPVNRYIQISLPKPKSKPESSLVLPDDYKPIEERYVTVKVVAFASDVRFKDQLVMTLKMRSAIDFVHAVFTCDQ